MELNECDQVHSMRPVSEEQQTHQLQRLISAEGNHERLQKRDDKVEYWWCIVLWYMHLGLEGYSHTPRPPLWPVLSWALRLKHIHRLLVWRSWTFLEFFSLSLYVSLPRSSLSSWFLLEVQSCARYYLRLIQGRVHMQTGIQFQGSAW